MVDDVYQVELTASFLERLEAMDAFMSKANLSIAIDDLLSELRATVIPNLARFPRIGRRYVDNPPQSVEALAQLAILPEGSANALCEYLFGEYLVLYVAVEVSATVYFLSIRYHRQLSFDFARHWPTAV